MVWSSHSSNRSVPFDPLHIPNSCNPQKTSGTYTTKNWIRDPWSGSRLEFGNVELKNHSDNGTDLPDPSIIRLHACVCRIINAGGAGKAVDKVVKDAYRLPHLAPNGTTDVDSLISLLLTLPKPSWTP